MPAINNFDNNALRLSNRVFGNAAPTNVAEAKKLIDAAPISTAEKATLHALVADLPKLNDLNKALSAPTTSGADAAAAAFGGKPAAALRTGFDFPSKAEARQLADKAGKAMVEGTGASKAPSNLAKMADYWEKKDPQALKQWKSDPRLMEAVKLGAKFSMDDGSNWLVERSITQNIDVSPWKNFLLQQGLIKPLSDNWMSMLEASTFFLECGAWVHDDQEDAGWAIMGKSNAEKHKWENAPAWNNTDRERLAALVSMSGSHAYEKMGVNGEAGRAEFFKQVRTDPEGAKAMIRSRLDSPCTWLDDAGELKQFTDSLFILKLADRSRASALSASGGGAANLDALKNVSPFNSSWGRTIAQNMQ